MAPTTQLHDPTGPEIAPSSWRPTADEITRILEEMRPIVAEFARRSELFLGSVRAGEAFS